MATPLDWLLGTKNPLNGGVSGEPAWYDYDRTPLYQTDVKSNYAGSGGSGEPAWYDYDRSLLINNVGKAAPSNNDIASILRAALTERRY